ncbi:hypothetical protein CHA01nite_36920 [Chryseobacterium hagamense]|uniref:Uncharacterized protein n=1 Tax=Chryseobacterium hagamense TaxID=395935 RepID=A0A511YRX6_9FLAO|nr:hypothetical protein CHA01nite_36920 [Chryseobacterium hagamense]
MKPQTEGSTKSKVTKEALTHKSHEIEETRIAHILEHIRLKIEDFFRYSA